MKNITPKFTDEQTARYRKNRAALPLKLLATFEAGRMLAEIRDEHLYKIDGHENFKVFCQEVLKVSGAHAYKMIEAFRVKSESPACDSITTVRQSLTLRNVPKEDHNEVIEQAKITGSPTGKNLAKAIVEVAAKKPAGTAAPKPPTVYCETGVAIPQALIPLWVRRDEVKELQKALQRIRLRVKEALDENDKLYLEIRNHFISDLKGVEDQLQCAIPYAVCGACQGKNTASCTLCAGRGLISEHLYKHALDPEIRKFRESAIASKKK